MKKYNQDFWNERYSQKEFIYGENPNEYFKEKLAGLPAGKILFPAEGEGRNAVFAAKTGWVVSAFDQSEAGKKKAELLALKNGVHIDYTVSDAENISYPENSFDALVLVYAHFHADKRTEHHKKLSSFLKKGGILILEAFSKHQAENQEQNPNAGGPRNIDMLYNLEEIKKDFKEFEFTESYENTIELNEGNYHIGKASVIRIFANKK